MHRSRICTYWSKPPVVGYMAALNDIHDGGLDTKIEIWRPDLAEQ